MLKTLAPAVNVDSLQSRCNARPQVVIIGAGFGGLNAAKALKSVPVDVTVIDRNNYHLFQPLLYQVATAGLSPAQIATPIRKILAGQGNTAVLMDEVIDVDTSKNVVVTRQRRIAFDYLIVATGARHAYFGHESWEKFAPGLKQIDDATLIRRRVLTAFERAEVSVDEAERKRLLTFAIVGAGPTGVEMAGAIAELARKSIVRDFKHVDTSATKVILVEAGPRVLPTFPESLSESANRQLARLGVSVVLADPVVNCDKSGLKLQSGNSIESATVIWGAGVMASSAAKWLSVNPDRAGRVPVGSDLRIVGHNNIFVIGDTAVVEGIDGRLVPGVAPAAKQMGKFAAKAIVANLSGKSIQPFVYRDYGNLATIGRKAAVADFGSVRLHGFPAWLVWSFAHIGFLIGFQNRFTVMLEWAWSYLTYSRGARLITGSDM